MFKRGDMVKYVGKETRGTLDHWSTFPVTAVFGNRIMLGCSPNSRPAEDFVLDVEATKAHVAKYQEAKM